MQQTHYSILYSFYRKKVIARLRKWEEMIGPGYVYGKTTIYLSCEPIKP